MTPPRYGPVESTSRATARRFWDKVLPEPATGCWLWTGQVQWNGYGSFWSDGRGVAAHRYSYEASVGPVPPRHDVDHVCRQRSCVNPDHLRVATRGQNNANSKSRDTASGMKGVWRFGGPRHPKGKPWRAGITLDGKKTSLGVFATKHEAAIAYDEAAVRMFGEFALTNRRLGLLGD